MGEQIELYRWPKTTTGWRKMFSGIEVLTGDSAGAFLDMVEAVKASGFAMSVGGETRGIQQVSLDIGQRHLCGRFMVVPENSGDVASSVLYGSMVRGLCHTLDIEFRKPQYVTEVDPTPVVEPMREVVGKISRLATDGPRVVTQRGFSSFLARYVNGEI